MKEGLISKTPNGYIVRFLENGQAKSVDVAPNFGRAVKMVRSFLGEDAVEEQPVQAAA